MTDTEKTKLFYRQKVLLGLVEAFGRKLNSTDLQKLLFLYCQTYQKSPAYDFVPYRYGCFSFQSYADRNKFARMNLLADEKNWVLHDDSSHLNSLPFMESKNIRAFAKQHVSLRGHELIRKVYTEHPYYAINSELAEELLSDDELFTVSSQRPRFLEQCFYTIGYEGITFEAYLNKLIQSGVQLLCDVRRNPISRKYGFSKKTLSGALENLGIQYLHIPDLGIASAERTSLNSFADYQELFNRYEKTTLAENHNLVIDFFRLMQDYDRIAITCFEADSVCCHRGRIAKSLRNNPDWNYPLIHL